MEYTPPCEQVELFRFWPPMGSCWVLRSIHRPSLHRIRGVFRALDSRGAQLKVSEPGYPTGLRPGRVAGHDCPALDLPLESTPRLPCFSKSSVPVTLHR